MSVSGRADVQEIKHLLQAQIAALVVKLAPEGHRSGRYWIARNPTRNDENIGSFYIWLQGGAPGAWRDSATGETGDVIQLIRYCLRLRDFKETMDWARGWLGIAQMPKHLVQQRVEVARKEADARQQREADRLHKNRRAALAIYLDAKKQRFGGSPADRYLKHWRGVDVALLGRMPGALGCLPDRWHRETDTRWPVMIAGLTDDSGKIVAVHSTFLARDGIGEAHRETEGKAPVKPRRKIWPDFSGGAIRLWRGESGLSIGDAIKNGLRETLVIVEGVEDGLSIALACPELRVWCAGSLGNLGNLKIPECIDEVIVCADNDWGKPEAQAQLDDALEVIGRQGPKVSVARSHIGKDVNSALTGGLA